MVHNDENNDSLSEIGGKEEIFFDVILIIYHKNYIVTYFWNKTRFKN